MLERRRVVVSGRVQGVFFRDTCRRQAAVWGVRGWVRNRPDGTVEAVFEGEPADVEHMLGWVRVGPRGATVTHVEVFTEQPAGLRSFDIVG
jgi:acylphosphatase